MTPAIPAGLADRVGGLGAEAEWSHILRRALSQRFSGPGNEDLALQHKPCMGFLGSCGCHSSALPKAELQSLNCCGRQKQRRVEAEIKWKCARIGAHCYLHGDYWQGCHTGSC